LYDEAEILDRLDEGTTVSITARVPAPLLGRLHAREDIRVEEVA
jgi:hypothetical protein